MAVRKLQRVNDKKAERPDRLMEWFGKAVMAADFDLQLQDKEKGESWRESSALFLFNKMMRHINKMMDSNSGIGQIHAIKAANYALMIATRLAGDRMPIEAEPKKTVIREIIYPYASHTESNVELGPPIIAGEAKPEDAKKANLLSIRSGIIHRGKKICDDGIGEQYKLSCGRKVYVGVFRTRYGITKLGVTCQRCLKKIGEKKDG